LNKKPVAEPVSSDKKSGDKNSITYSCCVLGDDH
jgi:hypothetical protein